MLLMARQIFFLSLNPYRESKIVSPEEASGTTILLAVPAGHWYNSIKSPYNFILLNPRGFYPLDLEEHWMTVTTKKTVRK